MEIRFIPDVFPVCKLRPALDLSGMWEFRLDPAGVGLRRGWQEGKFDFRQKISIPGAPQAQGCGRPTAAQKHFFQEPFWVRRTFSLPHAFEGRRVWLKLGGIMPAARIFVNGRLLGFTQSSRTPQRVEITPFVAPGLENMLAVQVCAAPEMRLDGVLEWSGAGEGWSGLYRGVQCEATGPAAFLDAYIRTKPASGRVSVSAAFAGAVPQQALFAAAIKDGGRTAASTVARISGACRNAAAELRFSDFTPWAPAHPKLYRMQLELRSADGKTLFDAVETTFGMREIAACGNRFLLNSVPLFLRAFGDDHYYPETLCPPADAAWFRERLRRAKAYGFNAVKSCHDIIPEEYAQAADETGIIVFQEMPFGLDGRLRENRQKIDEPCRAYYLRELDGIVRTTRNHASSLFYAAGAGEMLLGHQTAESFRFFSRTAPRAIKRLAPHALVVDGAGIADLLPPYHLADRDTPKGSRAVDFSVPAVWKDALEEPAIRTDGKLPLVLHEYLWWSCYPDVRAAGRYRKTNKKPYWLDTLLKTARHHRQRHFLDIYRRNSLRLQALCRKDGLEYARRNQAVAGYVLWLLLDLNRWSEGVLDDFWRPKNVSASEFLSYNGETVLTLAREGDRCLRAGARADFAVAVSHYGEAALPEPELRWRLDSEKGCLDRGRIRLGHVAPGAFAAHGPFHAALPDAGQAYALKLHAELAVHGRVITKNQWDFWAFPETLKSARLPLADYWNGLFLRVCGAAAFPIPDNAAAVAAQRVDEPLVSFVAAGGACLLFSKGAAIENNLPDCNLFRTIPWNRGDSGNSGTVIAPHPALAAFPHDEICDLNFVAMIRGAYPLDFGPLLRHGVKPIIRAIDHYLANRNKAYMLEFRVGSGRVLAVALDVLGQYRDRIEARYLFARLAEYVAGPAFQPRARIPPRLFLECFRPRDVPARAGFQAELD